MSKRIDEARYVPEPPSQVLSVLDDLAETAGLPPRMPRWDDPYIRHLDGVAWWDAPTPRWWHRCWAQTIGVFGLTRVERCACGAIRDNVYRHWADRNSR